MDKYYGLKYYDSLVTFLFSQSREEHAKDATNNLKVKYGWSATVPFIDHLLLATTTSFTPEQASEVFGFDIEKAIKRHRRIEEWQLHELYEYCAKNNMLCYVYDILTQKIKEFEGENLL